MSSNFNVGDVLELPRRMQAKNEEVVKATDSLLQWLETDEPIINNQKTADVYNNYKEFCNAEGYKHIDVRSFGKKISTLGYEKTRRRVNGESPYFYIYKTF